MPSRKEIALHPWLRLATAASLIAFTGITGLGVLMVLPTARPPVTAVSSGLAATCKQHWFNLDRDCLSRGDPWMARPSVANTVPVEVLNIGEEAVEQPAAESLSAAASEDPVPPADVPAPEQRTSEVVPLAQESPF